MSITQFLILAVLSLIIGKWLSHRAKSIGLILFALGSVFWLQPDTTLGSLNIWLPVLSLVLVLLTWGIVAQSTEIELRKRAALILIFSMVATLLILKTRPLMDFLNTYLHNTANLPAIDLHPWEWLGISYLSFRLMGMLIDFRNDQLPPLSLQSTLIYALFPASLIAGPIDRAQRFEQDLAAQHPLGAERFWDGSQRMMRGLFRKFIIADSLALVALSPQTAADANSIGGAWLLVYIYAFYIFFDFSGYSDIAIGLGKWVGVDLPENFERPYFQQNLGQFWRGWHMTLTGWFRTYFFLPFSRGLLRRKYPVSEILVSQLATMLLIGLWHGVQGHFIWWGIWHGVGLYAHHLISKYTRRWYLKKRQQVWWNRMMYASGVFATFHFVVLGWIFFALPEPFEFIGKLFGL